MEVNALHNANSRKWDHTWPPDTSVESLISRWLSDIILGLLVKKLAGYPKHAQNGASSEVLLYESETPENAFVGAPPQQKAVHFCPLPGQVRHLIWWLVKYFVNNIDVLHMCAEIGNANQTEMELTFQKSQNPSVFISTLKVEVLECKHSAAITIGVPMKIQNWMSCPSHLPGWSGWDKRVVHTPG